MAQLLEHLGVTKRLQCQLGPETLASKLGAEITKKDILKMKKSQEEGKAKESVNNGPFLRVHLAFNTEKEMEDTLKALGEPETVEQYTDVCLDTSDESLRKQGIWVIERNDKLVIRQTAIDLGWSLFSIDLNISDLQQCLKQLNISVDTLEKRVSVYVKRLIFNKCVAFDMTLLPDGKWFLSLRLKFDLTESDQDMSNLQLPELTPSNSKILEALKESKYEIRLSNALHLDSVPGLLKSVYVKSTRKKALDIRAKAKAYKPEDKKREQTDLSNVYAFLNNQFEDLRSKHPGKYVNVSNPTRIYSTFEEASSPDGSGFVVYLGTLKQQTNLIVHSEKFPTWRTRVDLLSHPEDSVLYRCLVGYWCH